MLATNLTGNYPSSVDWGTNTATSPAIDLTGATSPQLSFYVWLSSESSYDGFNLKISTDGTTFTLVPDADVVPTYSGTIGPTGGTESAWYGGTSSWVKYTANLSAYAGSTVYLRFDFRSDVSSTYAGAYVDDLLIVQ